MKEVGRYEVSERMIDFREPGVVFIAILMVLFFMVAPAMLICGGKNNNSKVIKTEKIREYEDNYARR